MLQRRAVQAFQNRQNGKKPDKRRLAPVDVPVCIHVLHDGDNGLLTDGEPQKMLDALNTHFSGSESCCAVVGCSGCSVQTGLTFVWGSGDGSPCVTYRNDRRLFRRPRENALKANRVGGCDVLNIWTGDLQGPLGYAQFPYDCDTNQSTDGVVIDYRTRVDGEFGNYNEGDTLTRKYGEVWMYGKYIITSPLSQWPFLFVRLQTKLVIGKCRKQSGPSCALMSGHVSLMIHPLLAGLVCGTHFRVAAEEGFTAPAHLSKIFLPMDVQRTIFRILAPVEVPIQSSTCKFVIRGFDFIQIIVSNICSALFQCVAWIIRMTFACLSSRKSRQM